MKEESGSKSEGFAFRGKQVSVRNLVAMHPIVVEIFQSGPKTDLTFKRLKSGMMGVR